MAAERAPPPRARASPSAAAGPGPAEPPPRTGLSLPGVLHFIQHEWARFEAEKGRWEAERAELRAQLAFLQGERRGQERLKLDLVRRIRMLEFALKQERCKLQRLRPGAAPGEERPQEPPPNGRAELGGAWAEGRQLLRRYLEELGYGGAAGALRSRRARAPLGPPGEPPQGGLGGSPPGPGPAPRALLLRRVQEHIRRRAGQEPRARPSPPDDDSDEEEPEGPSPTAGPPRGEQGVPRAPEEDEDEDEDEDEEDSEDALGEFDFLGTPGDIRESHRCHLRDGDLRPPGPPRPLEGLPAEALALDGLGDLAELTVTNDNDGADVAEGRALSPRRSWSPRLTLRSHFDAVRALAFVPRHPALVTASEDATLKLWDLQRPLGARRSAALDVEPVYAFRGHRGAVLAVAVAPGDGDGDGATGLCCSGGVDARIRCWRLPGLDSDPYGGYDPSVLRATLVGHSDAVWALAFDGSGRHLASCSADGTVRLWDPRGDSARDSGDTGDSGDSAGDSARDSGDTATGGDNNTGNDSGNDSGNRDNSGTNSGTCLSVLDGHKDHGVPTSVTFVPTHPAHLVAGFRSGATVLYDLEATKATLVSPHGGGRAQVNQVLAHPSQPLAITASDDGAIRYLDTRTGEVAHSVVAHLDAVTCLALEPSGAFLLSGSHDCSLRLWHLCALTCVQELPAHRRKHHEAVLGVAFHPRRPLSASAGADGLAKVFV